MTYTSSRVLPARPPPPRLELNERPDLLKIQLSRQLLSKEQERIKVQRYIVNLLVNVDKHFSLLILPVYNELGNTGMYVSAGLYGIRQYNMTYNVILCATIKREKFHLDIHP